MVAHTHSFLIVSYRNCEYSFSDLQRQTIAVLWITAGYGRRWTRMQFARRGSQWPRYYW